MHIGIEFFSLRHGFALERWFERTQIAKIHNVVVCHDVAGNLGGIVQHGFHFLTIECGGLRHTLAETAKIHTMSARRLGNLNNLSRLGTYIHLTFHKNVLQWFVCHNSIVFFLLSSPLLQSEALAVGKGFFISITQRYFFYCKSS